MKKTELQAAGCLVADTISEAAGLYAIRDFIGTKEEIRVLLMDMVTRNGRENIYFDFYYGTLSEEEKERILTCLTDKERDYLMRVKLSNDREDVYFAYEEMLFDIAMKLSLESCLFSTFYFSKTKETVWSNYDCRFVIFTEKEEGHKID